MQNIPDAIGVKDMANAIRILAMDAVETAQSGHPGLPLGMADVAAVLFSKILKHCPEDPNWPDRDRFVLSAGHGSMLLYAALHLLGYKAVSLEEIQRFRQRDSMTPGHPEYGHTPGVESTTGPLGQGLANAVGMAMAEQKLSQELGDDLVHHYTYVLVGDGCLMEGISHEALALAGHWKLKKLIVLWDDNGITIDGPTSLCTSEDIAARVASYGWETYSVDGHDAEAIYTTIRAAQNTNVPSFIACRTQIGYGSPVAGSCKAHGAPMGVEAAVQTRHTLGWSSQTAFDIPPSIRKAWKIAGEAHQASYATWKAFFSIQPQEVQHRLQNRELSAQETLAVHKSLDTLKEKFLAMPTPLATRQASGMVLRDLYPILPLLGGSADLSDSNQTHPRQAHRPYVHYGPREHAMAAILNGISLHKGFIPYGGTFLVFSDYCRPAIRLAALMKLPILYIMTHDSIGLGEDGPTHQPVEHLASFRAMPNIHVLRPADAIETVECWQIALESPETPSMVCLTRQNVPCLRTSEHASENLCAKGAYVLREVPSGMSHTVDIWSTGSEVSIACEARTLLKEKGIGVRVISFPCWSLFEAQPQAYRSQLLQGAPLKVALEAASPMGWERYVGSSGLILALPNFGISAPGKQVLEWFGFTAEQVTLRIQARLANPSGKAP